MISKRHCLVAAVCTAAACVPASEARPPAGAGGFSIEPSAAARGEPFQVGDWSLTIEKVIVAARISVTPLAVFASPSNTTDDHSLEGGFESVVFDGSAGGQFFAPGASVGRAELCLRPGSPYFYNPSSTSRRDPEDFAIVGDVDRSDLDRFEAVSDDGLTTTNGFAFGESPTVLLDVKGRRGDQVLELRVAPYFSESTASRFGGRCAGAVEVEIRANALSLARLEVRPERAFLENDYLWRAIVDADADGDGVTTGAELRAASLPLPPAKGVTGSNVLKVLASILSTTLLTPQPAAE